MTSSQKKKFAIIFITITIALVAVLPSLLKEELPESWPVDPVKLGLDLKGGSYLVLSVVTPESVKSRLASIASSIKSTLRKEKVGVIRSRQFGSSNIEVTLLGATGSQKTKEIIQEQHPELEFLNQKTEGKRTKLGYRIKEEDALEIRKNAVEQAIETIRDRVDQYGVAEPTIQRSGQERIMVQLPDITNIDQIKETIGSVAKLEFKLVATEGTMATARRIPVKGGGTIAVEDDVLMSGDAIETANVEINPNTNEIEVSLKLNSSGAKTFDQLTADNVGRRLAIILDGKSQSAPQIRDRISGGIASISGNFLPEEAHRLAIVLRSGALPAPLIFEEERTVGASLGSDSIEKGLKSMLIGSLLVIVFILFYYKKAGILAVTCLVLNLVFLMALLAIVGATLTLPGIAGLVLTVGMAVDANVIIFERIKEELRLGATARASSEAGFMKAHWTILDANITTLLTGIILYGFGTGPIKGFAVTLCLGIITSLFTALFVAKFGFEILKLKNNKDSLSI